MDLDRKLAFSDLDEAIKQILSDTLTYLGEGTKAVDPMTRKTYEYYTRAE